MEYNEDDFLMLSGIQHFTFCRRQWALIYTEQLWQDNLRTAEGNLLHDNCHDSYSSESRGDVKISRGMPVFSATLGLSGECDVVEFRRCKNGISIFGQEGLYQVYPVEYKHGEPKDGDMDVMQLTAQAICLEEMHEMYRRHYIPKVKTGKHCNACSLKELCMPKLMKYTDIGKYIEESVLEKEGNGEEAT